jgi:hypothetical protein
MSSSASSVSHPCRSFYDELPSIPAGVKAFLRKGALCKFTALSLGELVIGYLEPPRLLAVRCLDPLAVSVNKVWLIHAKISSETFCSYLAGALLLKPFFEFLAERISIGYNFTPASFQTAQIAANVLVSGIVAATGSQAAAIAFAVYCVAKSLIIDPLFV